MKHLLLAGLFFILTAFINGEEIVVDVNGKISRIGVSNNYIYLFDSADSSIWKLNKRGKVLATYNKKGEGPGELKNINGFQFLKGGIYLFSNDKCLMTDHNLSYLKEFRISSPFVELNNGNRIICSLSNRKKDLRHNICLLKKQNIKIEITEILNEARLDSFTAFTPIVRVKTGKNNQHFAIPGSYSKGLQIYNENGTLLKEIVLNSKLAPVTKEFKEMFFESIFRDPRFQGQKKMQEMIRKMTVFAVHFPQMQDFYIDRETGSIYIKTYERIDTKSAFLKYNDRYEFIEKIFLTDTGIDISNQSNYTAFDRATYYYLYENSQGQYIIYYKNLSKQIKQ